MDFLNPGILGSAAELFRVRHAKAIERDWQTEPVQLLRTVTRPYILRRLKTDKTIIHDLPDKIEIKQYCHLTTEQTALYQSVVDEIMPKIEKTEGIARRGHVLAAMTKLKQVGNHPAQLLHDGSEVGRRSGKAIRLEEILDEVLAEGDKALLFTQFTEARCQRGGEAGSRREATAAAETPSSGPAHAFLSAGAGIPIRACRTASHAARIAAVTAGGSVPSIRTHAPASWGSTLTPYITGKLASAVCRTSARSAGGSSGLIAWRVAVRVFVPSTPGPVTGDRRGSSRIASMTTGSPSGRRTSRSAANTS